MQSGGRRCSIRVCQRFVALLVPPQRFDSDLPTSSSLFSFQGKAWSQDEDDLLLSLFETNGPKWQHIAKSIPGRTGLCCRNRWRKFKGDEKVTNSLLDLEERQKKTGGNAGGTRSHPQGGRGRRSVSFQTEGGQPSGFDDMDVDSGTPSSSNTLGGGSGLNGQNFGEIQTPYGTATSLPFQSPATTGFDLLMRPHGNHDRSALDPPSSSNGLLRSPHHPALQSLVQQSNSLGNGGGLQPSYADQFSIPAGNQHLHQQVNNDSLFGGPASMSRQDHAGMLFSQDLGARLSAVEHQRNGSGSSQGGQGNNNKNGLFNLVHQDSTTSNGPPAGLNALHRDNPNDPIARLLAEDPQHNGTPSSLASASSLGSSPAFATGSSPSGISPSSLSGESFATPASDHHHHSNSSHHPSTTNSVHGGSNNLNGGLHLGGGAASSIKPPSHHVHFPDHPHEELDQNDNPTWVTSFLASLHHPSASLPPTALNSPVFTGAWDSGLFSAPPSPQKHLFMHLPPMLEADDLSPLPPAVVSAPVPLAPIAPTASHDNKGFQSNQPQTANLLQQQFLRSPHQQTNSLQASLHQQRSPQPPQLPAGSSSHTLSPYPPPLPIPSSSSPGQNTNSQPLSSSFSRPHPQLASPRRERSPLPTTGTMAPPPLPTHSSHGPSSSSAQQQQHGQPHPSAAAAAGANGQVNHLPPLAMPLPYLTWDPRPQEEQTNAVPMVLVPMSILAGLIERASMVDAHGNLTGKSQTQNHMR